MGVYPDPKVITFEFGSLLDFLPDTDAAVLEFCKFIRESRMVRRYRSFYKLSKRMRLTT